MREKILEVIKELKKQKKRNFNQTFDLIINLKGYDPKNKPIKKLIILPHSFGKKPKICAFLEEKKNIFDLVLTSKEISELNERKFKKIAKEYNFFISSSKLMPQIAKKFGKILGPLGKMPDPTIGSVITNEEDKMLISLSKKLERTILIKTREKSIKIGIGKEDGKEEEIAENVLAVYNSIIQILPKNKENIKSVMLKLTMSKPMKII